MDISNVVLNMGCGHGGTGLRSQTHYVYVYVEVFLSLSVCAVWLALTDCTYFDLNLDFDDGCRDGELCVVGGARSQFPRLERHVDMCVLDQCDCGELLDTKWQQTRRCMHRFPPQTWNSGKVAGSLARGKTSRPSSAIAERPRWWVR